MAGKLEQLADEVITTDLLIIGGGLSGCTAAIRARQQGNIDVAIMEKAYIKYSGDQIGLDDYCDWRPEYYTNLIMHPLPNDAALNKVKRPKLLGPDRLRGGLTSWNLAVNEAKNYASTLTFLEEIGVKIREDDGSLKLRADTTPVKGLPNWHSPVADTEGKIDADWVYYRGTDLKEKLVAAVQQSGARIFNRTMLTSLLIKDGAAVGATAVNTQTGKYLVFKAKVVLMATGGIRRMYLYNYAPFPQNLFYHRHFAGNNGGGVIAAYRAGAKLCSLEFIDVGAVVAGVCTTGGAGGGWFWPLQNSKSEYFSMFDGYVPMEAPPIERDVITYIRGSNVKEQNDACYFTAATEYPRALKFHKLAGPMGKGPPIEVRPFIAGIADGGGILTVNDRAESSIKNLFVAGNVGSSVGGNGSKAMIFGFIVGNQIREIVPGLRQAAFDTEQIKQVEADKQRVFAPLGRQGNVAPLELEEYVRKINTNYIGLYKIEPRLKRAAEIMRTTRDKFIPALTASDPHELMRALEVQEIIDLSEMHARFSLLRTESRNAPRHYRLDYPKPDDKNWKNTLVTLENTDGEAKYRIEKDI